jgi:UDP-xylose/UDP-N-acetylglucosamine transporter B4
MILGIIILKKEYPLSKYVSVVMVTVGIFMATLASASNAAQVDYKFI